MAGDTGVAGAGDREGEESEDGARGGEGEDEAEENWIFNRRLSLANRSRHAASD